jgi:hypothetical protein
MAWCPPAVLRSLLLLPILLLAACGGGQYGFARTYEPTSEESPFLERVAPVSYEEVRRDPAQFRSSTVGWFGVVTAVQHDGNRARVALTHRIHQDRHLCNDETAGSCRVTVSDRRSGPFTAIVELVDEEDREGQLRVWVGSLLKVYGSPNGEFDDQGGPVITAQHYRHWPRGYYVTTAARGTMRQ